MTTSAGYTGRIAWDATSLYIGMQGPDVASHSSDKWLLMYLGGTNGTTTGVAYKSQQPALPFGAKFHVRWKADNTFTNALTWNGTAWVDAAWDFTGNVFEMGDYIELRIPRANLGSPAAIDLHVDMINEVTGGEFTFAGVPKTSFGDGKDPDYAHYFHFDLGGCDDPSMYVPN